MRRKAKNHTPTPMGKFLRKLREKKRVTLRKVGEATGLSHVYISQLETGARRKLPTPEKLKPLAHYFNVTMKELLEKAGYVGSTEIIETFEQRVNKAFLHAINDPRLKYGTRIRKELDLNTKRFIIAVYEKFAGRKLL